MAQASCTASRSAWSPWRTHGDPRRAEWTTPIDAWEPDGDRLVFTRGNAVRQLPEGLLDHLDLRMAPGSVHYDIAPAEIAPA